MYLHWSFLLIWLLFQICSMVAQWHWCSVVRQWCWCGLPLPALDSWTKQRQQHCHCSRNIWWWWWPYQTTGRQICDNFVIRQRQQSKCRKWTPPWGSRRSLRHALNKSNITRLCFSVPWPLFVSLDFSFWSPSSWTPPYQPWCTSLSQTQSIAK